MEQTMKVIDCDVHNIVRNYADLLAYFPDTWKMRAASGLGIVSSGYYSPIGTFRRDAHPPGGGPPGSDPLYLKQQLMDLHNVEYAILTGEEFNISNIPDFDFAAATASAYNDYVTAEWLPQCAGFKASMIVATQDPQQAAEEIDRMAGHPDVVQVLMSSAARFPYGQRFYYPIYEAAERNGLPIAIHPGVEGAGINTPPTAAGYPSTYLEWHTCLPQTFMSHLVSLVCEGVFEKFPGLKFVFIEGGFSWLAPLMWRLDKNYKALRILSPWLKKMPSEYIREHCFFTTQPIEEPANPRDLLAIFDMVDAENMLLYSSDYPHWDFDAPMEILKLMSPEGKRKIMYDNAKKLYKL